MPRTTYIEFGSIINKKKKIYQELKGDVYDNYMLSRYFNDIFLLNKFNSIKILYKHLHHKKDFKFNLINLILLKNSMFGKFYEFGQTLFEKVFFMKSFSKILNIKIKKKIKWYGNDVSDLFNFFCNNFFKKKLVKVDKKPMFIHMKNSVFFAKGISLLYEKNNLKILKYVMNNSNSGSFDLTVCKERTIQYLNTGYKMYYPSKTLFVNTIPKTKNFQILFRNIKSDKNKIYFEVVYGKKKEINKFKSIFKKLKNANKKNKLINKIFDLNGDFKSFDYFKSIKFLN